jgi:parvulin-like peptidyl-prolyl isomerase
MKHAFLFLLMLASLTVSGESYNNSIIAVVNQSIITSNSIQPELNNSSSLDEKKQVINNIINKILQQELIKKFDLGPSQYEIEEALIHVSKKNKISLNELKKNTNFAFILNDINNNLSIFNLKNFITKDIKFNITDDEVTEYCQNIENKLIKQIKIAEIVIIEAPDSNSHDNKLNSKIIDFLDKLSNHISKGASFINLAKLHSQDSTYSNGGISDWTKIDTPLMIEIDNLQKSQVSKIYQRGDGWAIAIKIDERNINLILEKCKKELINLKAEQYFLNYINNYRKKAKIKIYTDNL